MEIMRITISKWIVEETPTGATDSGEPTQVSPYFIFMGEAYGEEALICMSPELVSLTCGIPQNLEGLTIEAETKYLSAPVDRPAIDYGPYSHLQHMRQVQVWQYNFKGKPQAVLNHEHELSNYVAKAIAQDYVDEPLRKAVAKRVHEELLTGLRPAVNSEDEISD